MPTRCRAGVRGGGLQDAAVVGGRSVRLCLSWWLGRCRLLYSGHLLGGGVQAVECAGVGRCGCCALGVVGRGHATGARVAPEALQHLVVVEGGGAGRREEAVDIALEAATVDDLAFAILGIEAQLAEIRRPLSGLRELYDQARKRGGVGANTVAEVFFNEDVQGANK